MKKTALFLILFAAISGANAADKVSTATATWDATARKDTTAQLTVTPLGSLSFTYAPGIKAFNQVDGTFDVAVKGVADAEGFKLTSKLNSNTLSSLVSDNKQKLDVGARWQGQELSKDKEVTLVDTANNITSGFTGITNDLTEDGSSRGRFTFYVSGAKDETDAEVALATLPDGEWQGDVSVDFVATWTTP